MCRPCRRGCCTLSTSRCPCAPACTIGGPPRSFARTAPGRHPARARTHREAPHRARSRGQRLPRTWPRNMAQRQPRLQKKQPQQQRELCGLNPRCSKMGSQRQRRRPPSQASSRCARGSLPNGPNRYATSRGKAASTPHPPSVLVGRRRRGAETGNTSPRSAAARSPPQQLHRCPATPDKPGGRLPNPGRAKPAAATTRHRMRTATEMQIHRCRHPNKSGISHWPLPASPGKGRASPRAPIDQRRQMLPPASEHP
mmetsp:Transcript_102796/g.261158  ORF Transcript_102796/g.261158 Transcript_102796/m.261158 type:complete len:255 (+) Transcript_102796:555-1319(+)